MSIPSKSQLYTCSNSYRCCWSWRRTYTNADIHIYNCINMLQIRISDLNIQQFYGRGFYEGWHKQFFMLKGINMLNFNNILFICVLLIHIISNVKISFMYLNSKFDCKKNVFYVPYLNWGNCDFLLMIIWWEVKKVYRQELCNSVLMHMISHEWGIYYMESYLLLNTWVVTL